MMEAIIDIQAQREVSPDALEFNLVSESQPFEAMEPVVQEAKL